MTRHLVRLIWNRKRQNLLLTLEILCSFLVVFAVILVGLNFAINARKTLGYDVDRVWSVDVGRPPVPGDREEGAAAAEARARERDTFVRLLAAARELPEVEVASVAFTAPYINAILGERSRARRRPQDRLPVQPRGRRLHARCSRCPSWPAAASPARTTPPASIPS